MRSRRSIFLAVALCDLAMMALAISINLLPVFFTTLKRELGGVAGLSAEQLGRIPGITFAGLVVGILVTGPLADRLGGRSFAVGGNVLIAAGLAILGFAPRYEVLLLSAFIMGVGAGTLDMILSPIVAALQPERRTVAMNLLHSFYCTGAVATILVAAIALRLGIGWRNVSLAMAPMPLMIGLIFIGLPLPPLVKEGEERIPAGILLKSSYFRMALVAIFLGGATELGLASWLAAYAERSLGFTAWTSGMAFLGFSLAMAVGRLGIAFLPVHFNPIRLMFLCCAATVVLFVLASFAPWNAVALAACIVAGLTGSCLWPSTLAVAADRFPHGGATMFGVLAAFGNAGGIFMPWAVGVVADRSSLRWGLATATFCPLLMMFALDWLGRRHAIHPQAEVPGFPVTPAPPI